MTGDIFKPSGKRSIAWWLQAVKWFGKDGTRGIMKGAEIATHHTRTAVEALLESDHIERHGESGQGHRPTYSLTPLGHRYLEEHQDELKEPTNNDEPPKAPAEFEDIYDCAMCRNANSLCAIHEKIEAAEIEKRVTTTPGYKPACAYCRKRGAACVRHGGKRSGFDTTKKRQNATAVTPVKSVEHRPSPIVTLATPSAPVVSSPPLPTPQDITDVTATVPQSAKQVERLANQPTIDKQPSFQVAFRQVLVDILLERYADNVTAKEVMDRLEASQ